MYGVGVGGAGERHGERDDGAQGAALLGHPEPGVGGAGEQVIVEGAQKVRDGMMVVPTVVPAEPPAGGQA